MPVAQIVRQLAERDHPDEDEADAEHAGRLWGAIEAEAERGRIGQWEEGERDEYADHLLPVAGPEFDRGVAAGRALTLAGAVQYALSVDSPS